MTLKRAIFNIFFNLEQITRKIYKCENQLNVLKTGCDISAADKSSFSYRSCNTNCDRAICMETW